MERLEEYAEEESLATETGNLPRNPIPEDLKTEMESVKREKERILRA